MYVKAYNGATKSVLNRRSLMSVTALLFIPFIAIYVYNVVTK